GRARGGRRRGAGSGAERRDGGDPDDGLADLVGAGQVDLRGDGPVAMALRVVEHLPDDPALRLLDHGEQLGPAGVGPGADAVVAVLGEERLERRAPGLGVPTRL